MITQEELKSILHYNSDTGEWIWLIDIPSRIKKGMKAGCIKKRGKKKNKHIKIRQKNYIASRLAFLYMTGNFPEYEVDHKDRNPLNDSWINLRKATKSQNISNKPGKPRKYDLPRGVYKTTVNKKNPFTAECGGKKLGYFPTIELAQKAYETESKLKYGEFTYHGNYTNSTISGT